MLLLVILAGVNDSAPLNETYFISLDLTKLGNATVSPTGNGHYTLWGICGADSAGNNVNCPHPSPAYPFDPTTNFGGSSLPADIVSHASFFYYMSRFAFAFYLIAVTFASIALVTGLMAMCSRLGGAMSAIFGFIALFFAVAAGSLMTAWVVTARNILTSAGINASIGVMAMGLTWGSVGALFLASFGFCCVAACCGSNKNRDKGEFAGNTSTTATEPKTHFWTRNKKVPFDAENTANGSY